MTMEPIFLDKPLHFEKIAGPMTRLSDDAQKWAQEITQEAYRQLPYLSDFEATVVLDRVEEERGYAFGSLELVSKSQMTFDERQSNDLPQAHIPIVVREQMLCPLDVFIHKKKYHPLTEARLRSAMFRADTFDAARTRPPEPSLYYDLQPPLGASGGGGGVKLGSAQAKEAAYIPVAALKQSLPVAAKAKQVAQAIQTAAAPAKTFFSAATKAAPQALKPANAIRGVKLATLTPILPQLHGRVLERHVDRIKEAMQDPDMITTLRHAPEGVKVAFASACGLLPANAAESAELAMERLVPNTVQFSKLANGDYRVKWANSEAYAPQEEVVNEQQAQSMLGQPDMVGRTEPDGSVTMSSDAPIKQTLNAEEIKAADQFGLWSVQDTTGNTLVGWCFPQLLSLEMQPLPLTLFSNGSQHALQDHIAGKLLGKSTDIPKGAPQGYGSFYFVDHGNARAFVPMTIQSRHRNPDGSNGLSASLDTGEQVLLHFAPEVKAVTMIGQGEYAVPDTMCWLPLKAPVELVSEPSLFTKTAMRDWSHKVDLIGGGNEWSFRGPGVAKLAAEEKSFLDRNAAHFLGMALGIEDGLLKEAFEHKRDYASTFNVRPLVPLAEKLAEAKVKVAEMLSDPSVSGILNFNLIKEAAILDDALTVDKVLALGFLNAENVNTFVDMIPGLEQAASRIAEMLIAARLGMKDVPEVALERLLKALDDVILGLRRLKQKELSYLDS